MRPRCSILTGGFDFSGCGDCTSCPPFEQTEMSNSEPSAIVLHGIPCMYGLYKFSCTIPHRVRGLREPISRPPLERISDPQISPTRPFFEVPNFHRVPSSRKEGSTKGG